MLQKLAHLDRRWIFLLVFIAVSVPLLLGLLFPEKPSPMAQRVFQEIDQLPEGSTILMAYDYDPPSQGELRPMAAAFTRHCALKHHKMIFLTLWPQGTPMVQENVDILKDGYPDSKYGRDYVNLGFRPGNEGVIRVIVNDLQQLYGNDVNGIALDDLELTKNLKNIQKVDLIVNVSAGTPGAKEWIQYASTPYKIHTVVGTTGVSAPSLYPYIPDQLSGMLGAIKAAAEYEQVLIDNYPELKKDPRSQEAQRRMGPQLIAHVLLIFLIIAGNVLYFAGRGTPTQSAPPPASTNPAGMGRSRQLVLAFVLLIVGTAILVRAVKTDAGTVWTRTVPVMSKPKEEAEKPRELWTKQVVVAPKDRGEEGVHLSVSRTIGLWVAAVFTLAILSFLIGDNALYKLAESVVIGTSAGYTMAVGFWTGIIQNLFAKLVPTLMRSTVLPGLPGSQEVEFIYLVPLVLSVLMLMRLVPGAGWISRWPLAFFIGATAGFRLVAHLDADFVKQIQATIIPYIVMQNGRFDPVGTLRNLTILTGVLSCLTYFFFSVEHRGMVKHVSRIGIWFLMITFGAGFGYTVMGRVSLLAARLEFLYIDWLWLIDPAGQLNK